MKRTILLLISLIFLTSLPLATAFTIEEGVCIKTSASNTTYVFGTNFSFDEIIVYNNSVYFDDNLFQIEADSGSVNVTIDSLNSMSFTVNATDNVVFNLGGFTARTEYGVYVDGVRWNSFTADGNGVLSFSYSSWSSHEFDILVFASTTTTSIVNIFPILLSVALIVTLVSLLITGTFTIEKLIMFMVVVIIVIATIQMIT